MKSDVSVCSQHGAHNISAGETLKAFILFLEAHAQNSPLSAVIHHLEYLTDIPTQVWMLAVSERHDSQ